MDHFTHEQQQKIWDDEHKQPNVLLQMDSDEASSAVIKFCAFLKERIAEKGKGLEMGCGKGRNVIWLALQGFDMCGFDFSPHAIKEATARAERAQAGSAQFMVQDATELWVYESNQFDFAIDCFASTDIETEEGRMFAAKELYRVLKPGGYVLAYLLSTEDEFHKEMIKKHPSVEPNAFHHPTGKFEKTFDEEEIKKQYSDFAILQWDRAEKMATFSGKKYACKHFWVVLQKPG